MTRALLFVPATRPDRFDKALAAGADAVIVDLEDAVAPADKDAARGALAAWLRPEKPVMLRLNGADTPWFEADLALCGHAGISAVLLPKAETAAMVAAVRNAGARHVLPMIETGAGLDALPEVAAAPGVERLAFGSLDIQVDLGLRDALEDELLPLRLAIVRASRRAGLGAPIDGVTTAIDDAARLATDVQRARRLGFAGKLCIHPKQVDAVRRGFAPAPEEIDWARRVIAASAGGAAVAVDGKMVDRPVLLRAEAILREAEA